MSTRHKIFSIFILFFIIIASCSSKDEINPTSPNDPNDKIEIPIPNPNNRKVYEGFLDINGAASVSIPEIKIGNFPLVHVYVYNPFHIYGPAWYTSSAHGISDGAIEMDYGVTYSNLAYKIVIKGANKIYTGIVDSAGNALISVPEMTLINMPLILAYIYTPVHPNGPNWYIMSSHKLSEGSVEIKLGSSYSNSQYIIAIGESYNTYDETLDINGSTSILMPEIIESDMPLISLYTYKPFHVNGVGWYMSESHSILNGRIDINFGSSYSNLPVKSIVSK